MNGYIAFYNGKQIEIWAESLYSAKQKAVKEFGVSRKKEHMITVMLAEKDGKAVEHTPDF